MISPAMARYGSSIIGELITKSVMKGLTDIDNHLLTAWSVVCIMDPDTDAAIGELLENRGELVCRLWKHYVQHMHDIDVEKFDVKDYLGKFNDKR